jgi:threonine-phosphate decarboxylase
VDCETLREALAQKIGFDSELILPSSGTTEWIFALPRIIRPERVLILAPTYADYADAAQTVGAEIEYFLAHPEEDFEPDLEALASKIPGHRLVFICNPNNPTGIFLERERLLALIQSFPETVFVVDESYLDFVAGLEASLLSVRPFPENLVVLRSFSKVYRIPGLRLGYAVAGSRLAPFLWREYLPWCVNRLAQVVGPWLLEREDHLCAVRELVHRERERLLPLFKALPGVQCFPGRVHFFLLRVSHPARKIWERLLYRHRILVREAANFVGLDKHYLRLALRGPGENDRLLQALREALS